MPVLTFRILQRLGRQRQGRNQGRPPRRRDHHPWHPGPPAILGYVPSIAPPCQGIRSDDRRCPVYRHQRRDSWSGLRTKLVGGHGSEADR